MFHFHGKLHQDVHSKISIVPNSLVSNISEVIGISKTNSNIIKLHHLRDKLIESGGDEQLLMYLIGSGGTSKSHVIFTTRFFAKNSVPVFK